MGRKSSLSSDPFGGPLKLKSSSSSDNFLDGCSDGRVPLRQKMLGPLRLKSSASSDHF